MATLTGRNQNCVRWLGGGFSYRLVRQRERETGWKKKKREKGERRKSRRKGGTANRLLGITLLTESVSLGGEADHVMAFTWNTGTQSHERNGGDRVFETDSAAQMRGQITDDGRQEADHHNRNKETNVAVPNVCKQMVDLFLENQRGQQGANQVSGTPQLSTINKAEKSSRPFTCK